MDDDKKIEEKTEEKSSDQTPTSKWDLKKILKYWGSFMAVCGIVGTVWSGFTAIKDKLDAIEASTADISDLKDQAAASTAQVAELRAELAAAINDRTQATQGEFNRQRTVDVELRASIDALRQEVRLRHGADLPTAEPGAPRSRASAIRSMERSYQEAQMRLDNARPESDPLSTLEGL